MLRSVRVLTVVSLGLLPVLTGCDFLKKLKGGDADAGAAMDAMPTVTAVTDAAAVDTTVSAVPKASNEASIARFQDEKASTTNDVLTVLAVSANARSVPNGDVVATINKGATVIQVAERTTNGSNYVLGVFDNPKTAGDKLMGWFAKGVFLAQPAADAGVSTSLNCAAPSSLVLVDGVAFCGRICTVDTECAAGKETCSGQGVKILQGKPVQPVKTCVGSTSPNAVKDAGAPAAVVDAGAPVVGGRGEEYSANGAGVCIPGYVFLAKDGNCHRQCSLNNCPTMKCTSKCVTGVSICAKPGLCP